MTQRLKTAIACLTALLLGACSNEGFMGETETTTVPAPPVAILFGAGSEHTSRADMTGDEAAQALNYLFRVYGVKTTGTTDKVVYPSYAVAYDGTEGAQAAGSTDTNTRGWEYVGLTNYPSQTLHFWDYGTDSYTFQAWSVSTGAASVTVEGKDQLTVTAASAEEFSKLYIADLAHVEKGVTSGINSYGGIVTFLFRNMTAKVRMGFYESIPGYTVSNITFRSAAARFADTTTEVILDGSFNAADETTGGTYHVTYNAVTQRAEMDNTATVVPSSYYRFGSFTSAAIGTDKNNPTWAGGSDAYHHVLPNEDNAGQMTLYIDFTLIPEDGSEDVIRVSGASVTVPATLMRWQPNYAYTYLFKITKDVNGTTGEEGTDPRNLYPITFDAIVAEFREMEPVETEL